jgi:hypothetical protein
MMAIQSIDRVPHQDDPDEKTWEKIKGSLTLDYKICKYIDNIIKPFL